MNNHSMGKILSEKAIWRHAQDELLGPGVDKQSEAEAERRGRRGGGPKTASKPSTQQRARQG